MEPFFGGGQSQRPAGGPPTDRMGNPAPMTVPIIPPPAPEAPATLTNPKAPAATSVAGASAQIPKKRPQTVLGQSPALSAGKTVLG